MCNLPRRSTVFENSSGHFIWICFSLMKMATSDVILASFCSKHHQPFVHASRLYTQWWNQYCNLRSWDNIRFLNRRTAGLKIDWHPPQLKTCCVFPGEIPLFIRQASCTHKSAQVTSMFRSSERTVLSSFRSHFLLLYHKKFEHFVEKNYVIILTKEEGLPHHHSVQSAHFK